VQAAARLFCQSGSDVVPEEEPAWQRLALDPPVRHAELEHRPLLRGGGSGAARCLVRPTLLDLHKTEQDVA
jgi:hypothetical protein